MAENDNSTPAPEPASKTPTETATVKPPLRPDPGLYATKSATVDKEER